MIGFITELMCDPSVTGTPAVAMFSAKYSSGSLHCDYVVTLKHAAGCSTNAPVTPTSPSIPVTSPAVNGPKCADGTAKPTLRKMPLWGTKV